MMYGTSNDRHLVRQRNQELLREVRAKRLEERLRIDRNFGAGAHGGLHRTIRGIRLALSGHTPVERTTTA